MKWCGIALVLVPPTCLGFVGLNGYLTMRAIQAQQQARLAAAAQQMSVLGQQTKLLGMSADPVQVQQHVDRIQGLSRQEWQSRLVSLNEEQSRFLQEGRIDEQTAAAIVAEREALLQCLTGRLDSPNPQRAKSDSNTSQPESEGTAAFEFPPPITAEQVMAMTKEEARAALFERAVAEKQEADDETRDRIVRERKMLLEFFKGNAPTSQPATMAAAATSPAAPLDAPPPLTAQQINAMSTAEARAALYERAIAERRNRAYPDVVERLKQERRLLIERLKQRDP